MQEGYDIAISLGGACSCSKSLRGAGMQFASFPFDWLNGSSLRGRAEVVACDFVGWLEEENLEPIKVKAPCNESHWRDRVLGFGYLHDFHKGVALKDDLPGVREKYARRWAHLKRLLDAAKSVLLVWVDVPTSPESSLEEMDFCLATFAKRWPSVRFNLLVLKFAEGVKPEDAAIERHEAVEICRFDYRDYKLDGEVWLGDDVLMSRWLASRYAVTDYRTDEEKRRWAKIHNHGKYRRMNTDSAFVYLVRSVQYRIWKHLGKRLARKGVI